MPGKGQARLNRQFDRIERKVPSAAKLIAWLRRPASKFVRIPIGVLLIVGGVFSFLPILGIWMLPLGLLLLALDVTFLRAPIAAVMVCGTRKWTTWRRQQRAQRQG